MNIKNEIYLNASDDISNEKRREIAAALKEAMPETTLIVTIIETQEVVDDENSYWTSNFQISEALKLVEGSPSPRIEKFMLDKNMISLDFGDDTSNEQRQVVIDIVKAVMPEVTVCLAVFEFQVMDGVVKDKYLIPMIIS